MPPNRIKKEPSLERRAQKRNARKRQGPVYCRILIVCEGEKTEPNYFNKFISNSNGSLVYNVEAKGFALNTIGVVDKAIELKEKAQLEYDAVWAVFDRDDFSANNFNDAINKAKSNNINVAWSNEAFELWFLLHFQYRNTSMGRSDYQNAISDAVNNSGKWDKQNKYVYQKNDDNNYKIMNDYGSQADAIRNAEKLHKSFNNMKFDTHNPCTTVYMLVRQLLGEDKDLIAEVMKKINNP